MIQRKFLFLVFVLISFAATAQLRLPPIFADHMVLQQNTHAPIWGWNWPGMEVVITTSWDDQEVKVKASGEGNWHATLKTPVAGGPYVITLTSSSEVKLNDVMIGEVWICSGQSNMEWNMNGAADGKNDVAEANYPNIRLYTVKKMGTDYPQVIGEGDWKVTTPDNARYFSAVGYYFGKKLNENLNVPIGLINSSWGGTPAEVWTPDSLIWMNEELAVSARKQNQDARWPTKPGVLYNAMIYPLMPLAIAGVIWYQGEGNTAAPDTYKDAMQQLIESWRRGFEKDFPFYFVQIAPFSGYGGQSGTLIREQQVEMLNIPKTGMVVISDHVEDVKDIHPKFKRPVGDRLANYALGDLYNIKGITYKCPLYKSMKVEKDKIRIYFDNADKGLVSKDGEPTDFTIAGDDGVYVPAKAKIDGSTVIVSGKGVKKPTSVRFAWDNGAIPNLFTKDGLPVPSFRTNKE